MNISFTEKEIDLAPQGFVRVRLTDKDTKRLLLEHDVEVLEIGVGKKWKEIDRRKFILVCRTIIQTTKQQKIKKIAVQLNRSFFPNIRHIPLPEIGSLIAQNFVMANYEPTEYKSKPDEGSNAIDEVLVCGETPVDMQFGFTRGQIIGEEVNRCRVLANTPGGDMTPGVLAESAKRAAKGLPIAVKVLDEKEMKKIGMGAVLGVGKGSPERPKFIILEYRGDKTSGNSRPEPQLGHRMSKLGQGGKMERPIVLVGKGVTFDTGGLSLKPADSMLEMHLDMSGGAAVIHAVVLAARLKLQKNVVALVPAVENMPGGESYRPGDILKSLSGKTIEVLNTDAEGRVILADALTYAERYKPRLVVDVATLTGASLIALGQVASAIMTKDEKLQMLFQKLGEESGDYVWPLPLWDEYEDMVKGNFGDFSNIPAKGNTRYAGVIGGGMFLYQFAKKYPWVHIDMAPRMTAAEGDSLSRGAAGAPVRLLLKVLEHY